MAEFEFNMPSTIIVLRTTQVEIERRVEECLKACCQDLAVDYAEALVIARQSINDRFFDLLQAERRMRQRELEYPQE
jgi:CRISPR/Cas system type I-B associated protein Csh2 (Cas7 group RAMP superfamily)